MTKITEKTWIPVGLVGSIFVTLTGGVFWLSTMYAQGNDNSKAIETLSAEHSKLKETLSEKLDNIHSDLSEIKTDIRYLKRK